MNAAIYDLVNIDGEEFYQMKDDIASKYRLVINMQIADWVNGIFKHTDQYEGLPIGIEYECTPDFGCCTGNPWPVEQRKLFASSSDEVKRQMMGFGLASLLQSEVGDTVHVVTSSDFLTNH